MKAPAILRAIEEKFDESLGGQVNWRNTQQNERKRRPNFSMRFLMVKRTACALLVAFCATSIASAKSVRFETNAGDFDLLLNPTSNPLLQGHVDNVLQYVISGRYNGTVINRAEEDFVLQMGIYKVFSPELPATIAGFIPIETFTPVVGVPAATLGLSNTSGTVGLALSGFPLDHDSGRSSFYINLTSNPFLDADFTVFAQVVDMTPINAIMALPQIDLTDDPGFGAGPGNLQFTDVPLLPNGDLVVISRAFVVPEPAVGATLGFVVSLCFLSRPRRRSC